MTLDSFYGAFLDFEAIEHSSRFHEDAEHQKFKLFGESSQKPKLFSD